MRNFSISIIIPNYNGKELLEKNLPVVIESTRDEKPQIIVVDDGSTDESVSFIRKNFPEVLVVELKKNHGFATAVNKGVEKASGEIVILLNSDIAPTAGFLPPLLAHFEKQEIFAVGCLQKSKEGQKTVLRGRGIGAFQRGFLAHARGEVNKTNTLWVSGGAGAFRKSIWNKLGGLDEIYNPFYWEDIDLSYRAVKAGYKIFFEPKSIVVHKQKEGAIRSCYSPTEIKRIAYRNQFIFYWKNINDKDLLISHLFWLPFHLITALLRLDWSFFCGFFAAVANLPKIKKKRREGQRLNKITDRELILGFEKTNS